MKTDSDHTDGIKYSRILFIGAIIAPLASIGSGIATYAKTIQRLDLQLAALEKTATKFEEIFNKNLLVQEKQANKQQNFNTSVLLALMQSGVDIKGIKLNE